MAPASSDLPLGDPHGHFHTNTITQAFPVQTQNTELWNRIQLEERLLETDQFCVHSGTYEARSVWVTVIQPTLANSSLFRSAFRTDIERLEQLEHAGIASVFLWGEHDEAIFYLSPAESQVRLDRFLTTRQLSWDEFVDIAWQIASAVQFAHNSGITHGQLSLPYFVVDDALRVQVIGFGIRTWIHASEDADPPHFQDLMQTDVLDLGKLLEVLMSGVSESELRPRSRHLEDIRQLILDSQNVANNITARDFQGHLGDLLLNDSGDVIDMVDQRAGQQTSRRSIVDELFDDEETFQSFHQNSQEAPNQPDYIVAGLILALIAVIASLLALQ